MEMTIRIDVRLKPTEQDKYGKLMTSLEWPVPVVSRRNMLAIINAIESVLPKEVSDES